MISPDLFKTKPPFSSISYSFVKDSSSVTRSLSQHSYNHSVNIIFPDTLHVPTKIKDVLVEDSEYYFIRDCPVYMLVESAFIQAFVSNGEVTLLSTDTLIDVDNCFSVTPTGFLILSISRSLFLKLGIEKGPAVDVKLLKKENRYLITINLKNPYFKPSKNNYKRVLNQLYGCQLAANIIVSWEPQDNKVCPSSIASYFHKKGLECEECSQSYQEGRFYNVRVPTFQADSEELFEWLGLFLLGATDVNMENDKYEYLSSYQLPEESESVGQVLVMQVTGLITVNRILALFDSLRSYIGLRSSIPWISLHVQGFEDAPVSWNLEAHKYSVFGDNNYTAVFSNSESIKTCKIFTPLRCRD